MERQWYALGLLLALACNRDVPPAPRAAGVAGDAVVATVNGDAIAVRELRQRVAFRRAEVADYFFKKYGADGSAGFWTSEYGGERPVAVIRARALDELVKIKVQQALFRRFGVATPARTGYGPAALDEHQAFVYRFTNDLLRLKAILGRGELTCSESELRHRYETERDTYFWRGRSRKVRRYSIEYASGARGRELAMQKATQVRQQLAASATVAADSAIGTAEATYYQVDEQHGRGSNRFRGLALRLRQGEVSQVIDTGASFDVIACAEAHDDSEYVPFEEARLQVEKRCVDAHYDEYLNRLLATAQVVVDRATYEAVTVE